MENNVQMILGQNISTGEDISKLISSQGVVINLSAGGGNQKYQISPTIYGVRKNELSEDSTSFVNDHISSGTVSLLSKKEYNKLHTLKESTRKRLREISIGYNDSFVPLAFYTEFQELFEKNRAKYFETRDELVEDLDYIKERFARKARKMLNDTHAVDGEAELEVILRKLPSKEKFINGFHFDMNVAAFPTQENLDMFSEDVQNQIRQSHKSGTEGLVEEATVSCLDEAVVAMSKIVKNNKESKATHPKTILGLKNSAERMKKRNIFGNTIINEFAEEILSLCKQDIDDVIMESERILAALYNFAKESDLEERINLSSSPFLPHELELMHSNYA